jgi:hypothetical protein
MSGFLLWAAREGCVRAPDAATFPFRKLKKTGDVNITVSSTNSLDQF